MLVRPLDAPDAEPDTLLLDGAGGVGSDLRPGVLVNAGGSGYYRVAYPTPQVELLAARLGDLAPLERYNLVSDTWAATLAGRAPLADLLRLARALADSGEGDPSVWSVVLGALGLFDRMVPDEGPPDPGPRSAHPARPPGRRPRLGPTSGRRRADPVAACLGTAHPRHHRRRPDDPGRGRSPLRGRRGRSRSMADTESAVLDIVASTGERPSTRRSSAGYRSPATPQEENRYLYALASFDDEALAARTFDLAMSEVRSQNAPFLIQALLVNRVTGPATWQRVADVVGRR